MPGAAAQQIVHNSSSAVKTANSMLGTCAPDVTAVPLPLHIPPAVSVIVTMVLHAFVQRPVLTQRHCHPSCCPPASLVYMVPL